MAGKIGLPDFRLARRLEGTGGPNERKFWKWFVWSGLRGSKKLSQTVTGARPAGSRRTRATLKSLHVIEIGGRPQATQGSAYSCRKATRGWSAAALWAGRKLAAAAASARPMTTTA